METYKRRQQCAIIHFHVNNSALEIRVGQECQTMRQNHIKYIQIQIRIRIRLQIQIYTYTNTFTHTQPDEMKRQTKHITHFTIYKQYGTTDWNDSWCSHSTRYFFSFFFFFFLYLVHGHHTQQQYAFCYILFHCGARIAISTSNANSSICSIGFLSVVLFSSVTACNISPNKINGAVKKSPMSFILSSIWYAWTSLKWKLSFLFYVSFLLWNTWRSTWTLENESIFPWTDAVFQWLQSVAVSQYEYV